jgi:hypothetical protein
MAATLYKKLSRTDVISTTYTKIRNIIDHYVDLNDGYLILREMLEDDHPGMQKDHIYRPPQSLDCDGDLQEYTNRFINWLTFERLNNRHYKDKEQVLHYLKGLHYEYEPAIHYVNTLLDTWAQPGINPKCNICSLPRTIDEFNNRSNGQGCQPVIRTIQTNSNNSTNEMLQQLRNGITDLKQATMTPDPVNSTVNYIKDPKRTKSNPWKPIHKDYLNDLKPADSRKSTDTYCDACGGHGHQWLACDFSANLIKALDYIATLDPTSRKAILENYHKEQSRCRKYKQMTTAGKARQLRDSGDSEGLYQLVQDIHNADNPFLDSSLESSLIDNDE